MFLFYTIHSLSTSTHAHLFATSGTTSHSPEHLACKNTRDTTRWPSILLRACVEGPSLALPLLLPLPLLLVLLLLIALLLLLLLLLVFVPMLTDPSPATAGTDKGAGVVGWRNVSATARTSSSTASRRAASRNSYLKSRIRIRIRIRIRDASMDRLPYDTIS